LPLVGISAHCCSKFGNPLAQMLPVSFRSVYGPDFLNGSPEVTQSCHAADNGSVEQRHVPPGAGKEDGMLDLL